MATIFPREEKAEALFGEILKNPEACHRLFFSWKYRCHQKDPLSVYFQLPIIDS